MIHVCSLARLHATVSACDARHIVTLLRRVDQVERPPHIVATNHLVLSIDDICDPADGFTCPADNHVAELIDFVAAWDRAAPMVIHCYAGISRSTAAAFVAACAINPARDEMAVAQAIRTASCTAQPNARIVAIADRLLKREGRMMRAVEALGPATMAAEGVPFRLALE